MWWSRNNSFLTDLHYILHARSCIHFRRFSHTPMPPRPLKRPKNFSLLFAFFNFYFLGLLFIALLGYGYTSRAGAMSMVPQPRATLAMFPQPPVVWFLLVSGSPQLFLSLSQPPSSAARATLFTNGCGSKDGDGWFGCGIKDGYGSK